MSNNLGIRPGPKGQVSSAPLDLSGLPKSGGRRVAAFAKSFLSVPKGTGARKPFVLRPWQRDIVNGLYNSPRPRQGLLSIPRGNGKSTLAAVLALYSLYADGVDGAQVLCVASDERQARITFDTCRRMIELSPQLLERTLIFKDRIVVPGTDSTLVPLPSLPGPLQGWDPTLLIVDELAFVSDDTWEAVTSAAGKRDRSLTLAISTPANPALGDFLHADGMSALLRTMREPSFRRLRLGQWVQHESAWVTHEQWADRADPSRQVAAGTPIVLFFDGSASGDSTALVGCTLDGHLFVVDIWANDGDERWRVPRHLVDATVDKAMNTYDVRELAADPWGWRKEIETWQQRYGDRVIEFPTNVLGRMAPATDRTYQGIANEALTHDGDPRLAAHVAHCVAKSTPAGDVVTKERKKSPRKIDAAVAAIGAYDRAAFHAAKKKKRAGFAVVRSA